MKKLISNTALTGLTLLTLSNAFAYKDSDFSRALNGDQYLSRVDLSLAKLENLHFEGTQLDMALLNGVQLNGANLAGANLRFSNLQGANLSF